MNSPDAGEQQRCQDAVLKHLGYRADPLPIGVSPEAIVEARPLQPVAVRDLDRIDLRAVQRPRDRLHMIEAVLVADRVHAVAQRDVLNVELLSGRIEGHAATPWFIRSAIFSAVLSAADVMMSRLPA